MTLQIDPKSAVFALSDALDLVGERFPARQASCDDRAQTALLLGLPEARLDNLVIAGLLHDIGVSSTTVHRRLVHERNGTTGKPTANAGTSYCNPSPTFRCWPSVLHHHTPWAELPSDLSEADALDSNLILMADRGTRCAREGMANPLLHREAICDEIESMAAHLLAPEVVRAFLAAADNEAFWIALVPRHVQFYLSELPLTNWRVTIEFPQFRHVARLVSSIVDAKSHFTASFTGRGTAFPTSGRAHGIERRCPGSTGNRRPDA
ncbi:MAG: hypothetical protein IPK39_07775 [Sulfuritalea sp.]|nr:hypothetical protein [Sulfuritalea sp.]